MFANGITTVIKNKKDGGNCRGKSIKPKNGSWNDK